MCDENLFYLVKRGMFFRPKFSGYTYAAAAAGKFTGTEVAAYKLTDEAVTLIPCHYAPEVSPGAGYPDELVYAQDRVYTLSSALRDLVDAFDHIIIKSPEAEEAANKARRALHGSN